MSERCFGLVIIMAAITRELLSNIFVNYNLTAFIDSPTRYTECPTYNRAYLNHLISNKNKLTSILSFFEMAILLMELLVPKNTLLD